MAKEVSVYERLTGGNRKQRKDLQRRLWSDDPGLSVVHANAAGIDIGNESHFVAVPPTRDTEPTAGRRSADRLVESGRRG